MKHFFIRLVVLSWALALICGSAIAEQHRATHLGNPATRFAPPLATPEDLRSRFRDESLKGDIAEVLRQWGWKGRLEDLFRASQSAEVRAVAISTGTVMPFMSSRDNGKPICLRNVTWAGTESAPAYLFNFASNGRNYRCITPKACSNFFVEDLGPVPVPALAIACVAPAQTLPGRPFDLCLTVRNPGTGSVPKTVVKLQLSENAAALDASNSGIVTPHEITWELSNLAPQAEQKLCARVSSATPGQLSFAGTATAAQVPGASSTCATKVIGIAAILIDAVDLEDPVEVGNQVTYDIAVTNQGSSEATNVRLAFTLPPNEEFISGSGPSAIQKSESSIATEPLPVLAPKAVAVWRVIVKALKAGDVRFQIELTSDQFQKPIHEEESTLLY